MRSIIALTCCAAMAACATPPAPQPDSAQPDNPQAIAAAFQMPMDPSLISCGALINVNALNAATEWTMGRARAAVLSGQSATVPDASTISADLTRFCRNNPSATIGAAGPLIGL